jgi:hypothetical protein
MVDEKIVAFLHEQTKDVTHSGRTFFEHLVGVHDLLQQRRAPSYVCLAGLFHSIYGTNVFRHQTVPINNRDLIVDLIGEHAELLAFIFCSCERPKALIQAAQRGPPYRVINQRDGEMIPLAPIDMLALLIIEDANLEEQGSGLEQVRAAVVWVSSIMLYTT